MRVQPTEVAASARRVVAEAMPSATDGEGSQSIALAASSAAPVAVTCGSGMTVTSCSVTAVLAVTQPGERDQPPAA